ncbi:MAG: mercury methylation corrinoid protein HgcA [Actinomycetota bacterium]
MEEKSQDIRQTVSDLTVRDHLVHLAARLGAKRNDWRVEPGLYRLGDAGPSSPVFVTANYRLSFDALRSALAGIDAYILVLDTDGINVWCAAGKGTFGTDELVSRIESTGLADVVEGRVVVVPQLGATGVSAHEARMRSGFKVEYGPIRAEDLPGFLREGRATPEMRRIRFDFKDRIVLVPVEATQGLPAAAALSLGAYFLDGPIAAAGLLGTAVAGLVGVPALLPYLPAKDYSVKGFMLGGAVAVAAASASLLQENGSGVPGKAARAASYVLGLPPLSAFIALNFTGATPYTSPSGVRREIYRYVPVMAGMALAGIILNVAQRIARTRKG